jgi:RNA polymerase sigma-54 factor
MELSQEIEQNLQTRVSPRLIAVNHILAISSQELQETIAHEVDENPALDLIESAICPVCGQPMNGRECEHSARKQDDEPRFDPTEQYLDNIALKSSTVVRDDDFDLLNAVAAEATLEEKLSRDLAAMLSPEQLPIAEYLVGSLDENGYLSCSIYEVCTEFDVNPEQVEEVLARLQSLDPPGIGARDLKECLALQLQYLAGQGTDNPLALRLVEDHLDEVGKHKFVPLAQLLGVAPADVEEAWEFIRSELNPHPLLGYDGVLSHRGLRLGLGNVIPDVIITESEEGFEVEVVESRRFSLSVNSMYRRLLTEADGMPLSPDERQHIQEYVSRARIFMANIMQRRQTIQKVTECLVECQADFLRYGIRHLKPLTRNMLADMVGVHESTISRATAAKYVRLPNGQVMAFRDFFRASLNVKDLIAEMVSHETEPLTDQEIASRLKESDYDVARRTVAKYRAQLGILPSSLR